MESNLQKESPLAAIHLFFEFVVSDIRQISAQLMELFDAQRIVYLKKSPKEKTLLKSVVAVLRSKRNWDLLNKGYIKIGGINMRVLHISLEDAEDLIDQKRTKLYVGNIPYPVDNLALWNFFAQYGTLDYSYILKPPTKKGPKGFGYVIYQKREGARAALSVKNYIDGVKLNCKLFMNKKQLKKRGTDGNDQSPNINSNRQIQNYQDATEDELSDSNYAEPHQKKECAPLNLKELKADKYDIDHQNKIDIKDCCCPKDKKDPALNIQKKTAGKSKKTPTGQEFADPENSSINSPLYASSPEIVQNQQQDEEENIEQYEEEFPKLPSDSRACCCSENKCEECWCDMIESKYFSPPCCLCDFKPDRFNCQKMLEFISQSKASSYCIHPQMPPPHEPWEHEEEPCMPCSKFQELKRELKIVGCKQYRLFSDSK